MFKNQNWWFFENSNTHTTLLITLFLCPHLQMWKRTAVEVVGGGGREDFYSKASVETQVADDLNFTQQGNFHLFFWYWLPWQQSLNPNHQGPVGI